MHQPDGEIGHDLERTDRCPQRRSVIVWPGQRGSWDAPRGEARLSIETDVVDAQVEAYRARDVERFLSHYADDASVVMFDGTVISLADASG
jgi:hypothetical protein